MASLKKFSGYLMLTLLLFVILHDKTKGQGAYSVNKVMSFFQQQQFDEAISYLADFEKTDSNNISLLGYVAYANRMNENYSAASKYYQRMLAIDSNNVAALQYISMDDDIATPQALPLLQRLVSIQPNKPAHHKNLAALFRKINQKDSALIRYKQAYELSPTDHRYVAPYAEILIDQEQLPKADSLLDARLEKDSLNIQYLVLRIKSAYLAKDYQHALIPGERLMRTGEKVLNPLLNVALCYYNLKQYPDCIRVCDHLLEQGFEIESVFFYKAKSFAKLNDYVQSNELLNICLAIAISKTAEMYYYNLAENNEATRQYKKAVSYYDSAFYLFKNPHMIYNAGRVTESDLKNEKLAEKYYARYLEKARPATRDDRKVYEYVRERMKKNKPTAEK